MLIIKQWSRVELSRKHPVLYSVVHIMNNNL